MPPDLGVTLAPESDLSALLVFGVVPPRSDVVSVSLSVSVASSGSVNVAAATLEAPSNEPRGIPYCNPATTFSASVACLENGFIIISTAVPSGRSVLLGVAEDFSPDARGPCIAPSGRPALTPPAVPDPVSFPLALPGPGPPPYPPPPGLSLPILPLPGPPAPPASAAPIF